MEIVFLCFFFLNSNTYNTSAEGKLAGLPMIASLIFSTCNNLVELKIKVNY